MTTLHEITKNHTELSLLIESEEVTLDQITDTMELVEGEFNDKAISIVSIRENIQADVNAIDKEIERLSDRKKVLKNKQVSMIEYLRVNMEASGITNIKCPFFSVTLSKGRDLVSILNESDIPTDYLDIQTVIKPIKKDILAALKSGEKVPGAALIKSKTSVRIK